MLSLFMSIAGGVSWEEVVRPLKVRFCRGVLGGSSHFVGVFLNLGDRCCPQDLGLWDPFQMAFLWPFYGL